MITLTEAIAYAMVMGATQGNPASLKQLAKLTNNFQIDFSPDDGIYHWAPPGTLEKVEKFRKHPVKAAGWRSRATSPALMPRYDELVRRPNSTAGIPRACGLGVRRCEPARQRAMLAGPRR